jgi:hypothetical protein
VEQAEVKVVFGDEGTGGRVGVEGVGVAVADERDGEEVDAMHEQGE